MLNGIENVAGDDAEIKILRADNGWQASIGGSKVVLAEAQGHSWLQRNWRPVTMLTFVALVAAKWLGFTAPGVTEAVEMELMRLIQLGLGGYIVGRSVEKGIKEWKKK